MDLLEEIFHHQEQLQEKLGVIPHNMAEKELQQFTNIMTQALMVELCEFLQCTPWKNPDLVPFGWKKTQTMKYRDAVEELADCLHFFVNICLAMGVSPQSLYNAYVKKNEENHVRKERGY